MLRSIVLGWILIYRSWAIIKVGLIMRGKSFFIDLLLVNKVGVAVFKRFFCHLGTVYK